MVNQKQNAVIEVLGLDKCVSILSILLEENPCISIISGYLEISMTMASYYTKRLHTAGLIKIELDRNDFRKRRLFLTPLGKDIIMRFKDGTLFDLASDTNP